jgi:hypothetical protein
MSEVKTLAGDETMQDAALAVGQHAGTTEVVTGDPSVAARAMNRIALPAENELVAKRPIAPSRGHESVAELPYFFENLRSDQLTEPTVRQMSEIFRRTFSIDFPEYAVCQPCGEQMPAWQALGLPEGQDIPQELLDRPESLPDCPSCGNSMELFIDPDATLAQLNKKFAKDAHVTLLRSADDGEMEGFTFGYERTLRQVFENEWKHRFSYTRQPSDRHVRDTDRFMAAVTPLMSAQLTGQSGKPVEIGPDSNVFCWNCAVVRPKLRGAGTVPHLIQTFFASLPPEKLQTLATIGETTKGTRPYKGLVRGGFQPVEGILSDQYVLLIGTLKKLAETFALPPELFKNRPV